MMIGQKEFKVVELKQACRDVASLSAYAVELVPLPLRHIAAVVDNQKYYIALHVRALKSLTWQKRKDLCEGLLCNVRIKGVPDNFYDYRDILLAIDREAFLRYLKEERNATR